MKYLIGILLTLVSFQSFATILMNYDFEISTLLDYPVQVSGNAATISSGELAACSGSKVMRSYISLDDPTGSPTKYRTEVTRFTDAWNYSGANIPVQTTYIVSFRVMIPSATYDDTGKAIIFQLHGGTDDSLDGNTVYTANRNPVFDIAADSGNFRAGIKGDDSEQTNKNALDYSSYENLGAIVPDVWTNIQVQFNVDHRVGGTGFVKIWRDGVLKTDYTGQFGYADSHGPYAKMGIYYPDWKASPPNVADYRSFVVYHDDFIVGDASETQPSTASTCGPASPSLQATAPTGFTATQSGDGINLSWTAPTTYYGGGAIAGGAITGYDIRTGSQAADGGTYTVLERGVSGTSTTVYPDIESQGTYCYQVRANTGVAGYWATEQCVDFDVSGGVSGPTSGDPKLEQTWTVSQNTAQSTVTVSTAGFVIPQDSLILFCALGKQPETWNTPSGFTLITNIGGGATAKYPNLSCYQKTAGASEPTSYSITASVSPEKSIAFVSYFSNPAGSPIEITQTITGDDVTTVNLPAIDGTTANALVVAVSTASGNAPTYAITSPDGYYEIFNASVTATASTRWGSMSLATKTSTDGDASSASYSTSGAAQLAGIHILIAGATVVTDTTPDAFAFADVTDATTNTDYTSCVTLSGTNAAAAISVTGGTYNINGGEYTATSGTVNPGSEVCAKQTSSSTKLTQTDATLTIGGVSDVFSVTTGLIKQFKFTTNLLRLAGSNYSGTVDRVYIYAENPIDNPTQTPLAVANSVSFTTGNFTAGSLVEGALASGFINALVTGTEYYLLIGDLDNSPYWIVPLTLIAE